MCVTNKNLMNHMVKYILFLFMNFTDVAGYCAAGNIGQHFCEVSCVLKFVFQLRNVRPRSELYIFKLKVQ